jgi:6,7-dimethyl-8-ribityllumazine synthase
MRSDVAPSTQLPDGHGLRLALVVARFNEDITSRLREGALAALRAAGVADGEAVVFEVPGAFELPLAARTAARSGRFDAVVCLGCVIRGATPHFEYVSSAATQGVLSAMLETGVPMAFGVLTTNSHAEAVERVPDGPANKGWEAAAAALEMARLLPRIADTVLPGIRV